jgi:ubiquitin-activating enzyme E1 C
MDTIDVSNLNRQFLFRPADVGRSKAEVAAARVSERVDGVVVTPHHGRIEDKPDEFYEQFHVIVLGLDSLEARSYLNAVACGFLRYEESADDDALMGDDPNQSPALAVDQSTIKPLIDGGTEGFKGHARVILPGVTPCFECTSWLFPPQKNFPLCTLAETPRNAAHCIEYARLIQWPKQRPDDTFDADEPEHVKWVYDLAAKRAATFDIPGVTLSHTLGVVKNIIPAIPSTNAIVAAECATEALKLATCCAPGMDNFAMYVGTSGVYTHTVKYEKDEACELCSAGRRVAVSKDATLSDVMDALVAAFPGKVDAPSVTLAGGANLYLRGPLEEEFKPNLGLKMVDLIGQGEGRGEAAKEAMLVVNDKKMKRPTRVRLRLE